MMRPASGARRARRARCRRAATRRPARGARDARCHARGSGSVPWRATARHRLDLLPRLRELATPGLLEEAARAPAGDGAIAAEDATHEHLLLLPLVQPAFDPARLERIA